MSESCVTLSTDEVELIRIIRTITRGTGFGKLESIDISEGKIKFVEKVKEKIKIG